MLGMHLFKDTCFLVVVVGGGGGGGGGGGASDGFPPPPFFEKSCMKPWNPEMVWGSCAGHVIQRCP